MTIDASELLNRLTFMTRQQLDQAIIWRNAQPSLLQYKTSPKNWSALECLAHLNLCFDFYLPELEKRIAEKQLPKGLQFKSSWLGNYIAQSMLPQPRMKKVKTFARLDENGSNLDLSTLETFIAHQERLLQLLNAARAVDLTTTKTHILLTRWVKLRLGDTFRFVVNHNERHLQQALKAVEDGKKAA